MKTAMQEFILKLPNEFIFDNMPIILEALEKEKEQIKPLVDALKDIINWNDDLEEDWGDARYRAKDALETYNQNK